MKTLRLRPGAALGGHPRPGGPVVPLLGSRFYTFLATDIIILALFAISLNLLSARPGSCRSAMPRTSASAPTPARS